MDIIRKISENNSDNLNTSPVTIAFLGDSVTQGCFHGYNDYDAVYHSLLKRKLNYFYPRALINIINAGIGGTTAAFGAERIKRDVLEKNPDLCVVSFGLNDCTGGEGKLQEYISSLNSIFSSLREYGCEVIYMTQNMMNTKIVDYVANEYKDISKRTMVLQNNGVMDLYVASAIKTAKKNGVKVCDCYSFWKRLAEYGVDTTNLLVNGINHPTEKMHELFANKLLELMFE